MRKIGTIGFAVASLTVTFLVWQHFRSPKLTGTWVINIGPTIRSTSVVSPDGSYVCQMTGDPDRKDVTLMETMKVKGSVLIYAITSDSQPAARVPRVRNAHI
jgi:hypothetical protein